MMDWNQIAWACFLYGAIGGDKTYLKVSKDRQWLRDLRNSPQDLSVSDIQDHIIRGFLNPWNCRLPNRPETASELRDCLIRTHVYMHALKDVDLRDDFSRELMVGPETMMRIGDLVAECYSQLRGCTANFAATATSKLLHIIAPNLFVMWDKPILAHYRIVDKCIRDSSTGFRQFHLKMQEIIRSIDQSFASASLAPPPLADQRFENYLSDRLSPEQPKSAAKFLDEYNWVVITNGVQTPPPWHP